MDENYVMSTSVLQYLEDIRTFMRESNATRPDENFDLFATSKNSYEDGTNSIQFESSFCQNNQELNNIDTDRVDQLSLFTNKMSIKWNSIENEELDEDQKEEDKNSIDINSNINSINSKENEQKEDLTFKKPKSTNKERAKKARQRKKKYYEDLEKRVEYLEKKVSELNNELEFLKQKVRVYEGQRSSLVPNSDVCIKTWLIDDWLKHIKTLPDSTEFMKTVHLITDSYGPFGKEKIKILDYAFESIIENMLCGGTKLLLYIIDKDIPQTPTEFENYSKLKKFEKFDKYPDTFVRNWLETRQTLNFTRDQLEHFYTNSIPKIKEIKSDLKVGIQMLLETRQHVYKCLMKHDLFKRNFLSKSVTKAQYLNILNDIKEWDMKLTYEHIFEIEKQTNDVEMSLEITDVEKYDKAYINIKAIPDERTIPGFVTRTYSMTSVKCS